jgi:alditol oxidase
VNASRSNWAGNYAYQAARIHVPENVAAIQALVRAGGRVKALGSRHSFNDVADSPGDLIALDRLNRVLDLDRERHTVTVEPGVKYGDLGRLLNEAGYALPNMASLPHISVAGACATATHGSGDRNRVLSAAVSAIELVLASGDLIQFSREEHGEQFLGTVVGLGGLGIVTRLTLDLAPAFAMRQDVYENLPRAQLDAHFEEIESSAYSVSLFTDWQTDRVNQVWFKRRISDGGPVAPPPTMFGATRATVAHHPIDSISAVSCTEQLGQPGPWCDRLPHFRMDFTPSAGEELQSEYLLPRRHALAAFRAVEGLRDLLAPLLQISEVRTVAADDLWMSPCYQRACVAIHFTWVKDAAAVARVLPRVEAALEPFNAVPHWGKVFAMPPARLQSLYPKLPDFQRLLRAYDPDGKFRNAFLDRYIFGAN